MAKQRYTVGVDVGGTNVKFGLINAQGKIVSRAHLSTDSYKSSVRLLIDAIIHTIRQLCENNDVSIKQVKGVGVGVPGLVDFPRGLVVLLPNIPGWKNIALQKTIESKLKVPVFIDNDVNVIALGEWKFGAGKGQDHLIEITLGTGVGGGLILDGKLYRGFGFAAGEIGHIPMDDNGPLCGCGARGCFETFVGHRRAQVKLAKIFGKPDIKFPDVYPLAKKKDARALRFWDEYGAVIGRGLVGVVNVLNPRLIVIGGGVSNNYEFFHKAILRELKNRCMSVQAKNIRIVRSKLGDDAGLIGAHVLVEESLGK